MNQHAQIVYRPYKVATPGTLKEVFQTTAQEVGGVKNLCALSGKALSTVHACLDPEHPSVLSFGAIVEAVKAGARRPVMYLCQLAGGAFTPGKPSDDSLDTLAARSAIEHAEFVAAAFQAREEPLTATAGAYLIKEIDESVNALMAARSRVLAEIERRV